MTDSMSLLHVYSSFTVEEECAWRRRSTSISFDAFTSFTKKTPALIGSICHIWACSIFSFLGRKMSNTIFFTEYIYYFTRSNRLSLRKKISRVWKNGNSTILLTFEAVLELWLLQFWYYEQSNRVRLIEDWILCRFLFLLF